MSSFYPPSGSLNVIVDVDPQRQPARIRWVRYRPVAREWHLGEVTIRVALRAVAFGCAGLLVLSGCASAASTPESSGGASQTTTTATPSAAAPSSAPAALPQHVPWRPSTKDVSPAVKLRAAELVEAIGTWSAGGEGAAQARARVSALGLPPSLTQNASALLASAPQAVTNVSFAQYGGILADTASVLVVADQWLQNADGTVTQRGTTVDVRLSKAAPRWNVTAFYPATPKRTAAQISSVATAVLTNDRLRLPIAASADVRSGTVNARVLQALESLSKDHAIDVSVIESGHPINVFGTSRPSDHPRGFAVDIWKIDGRPVVDPANHVLAAQIMRSGIAAGAYQAGGPVQLDPNSLYFSDDTHHDHIHLGFR